MTSLLYLERSETETQALHLLVLILLIFGLLNFFIQTFFM